MIRNQSRLAPYYELYRRWESMDEYLYIKTFSSIDELGMYTSELIGEGDDYHEMFINVLSEDEEGSLVEAWHGLEYYPGKIPHLDERLKQNVVP